MLYKCGTECENERKDVNCLDPSPDGIRQYSRHKAERSQLSPQSVLSIDAVFPASPADGWFVLPVKHERTFEHIDMDGVLCPRFKRWKPIGSPGGILLGLDDLSARI